MDVPKEFVEAGARAAYQEDKKLTGHVGPDWDRVDVPTRGYWTRVATACLAAIFGRAEVVWKNDSDNALRIRVHNGSPKFPSFDIVGGDIQPGDTLVIVRGW